MSVVKFKLLDGIKPGPDPLPPDATLARKVRMQRRGKIWSARLTGRYTFPKTGRPRKRLCLSNSRSVSSGRRGNRRHAYRCLWCKDGCISCRSHARFCGVTCRVRQHRWTTQNQQTLAKALNSYSRNVSSIVEEYQSDVAKGIFYNPPPGSCPTCEDLHPRDLEDPEVCKAHCHDCKDNPPLCSRHLEEEYGY